MTDYMFSIARDFSKYPGPRYSRQGPFSGEKLRKQLVKILRESDDVITINLDGTVGYGSSFLDEAFGGLVREAGFAKDSLLKRISFVSQLDPSYIDEIKDSISKAKAIATG